MWIINGNSIYKRQQRRIKIADNGGEVSVRKEGNRLSNTTGSLVTWANLLGLHLGQSKRREPTHTQENKSLDRPIRICFLGLTKGRQKYSYKITYPNIPQWAFGSHSTLKNV